MTMIRGFLYALARIRFDILDNFANDVEEAISGQRDSYIKYLEEEASKLSEEDKDVFWDYNIDRVDELRTEYPNTLRSSVLISCYSNLEKTLVDLHKSIRKSSIVPIRKLEDDSLSGSTIERVATCIKEDLGITVPFNIDSWSRIIVYKEIRNKVVHELGRISSSSPLVTKIETLPHVHINNINEIVFENEFSRQVIYDMKTFVKSLFKEIQEFKEAHKLMF
ncbi:hypothetical protein [Brevibacillus brevis]|nr:hypothetical protein [Brevibacillus brevis]